MNIKQRREALGLKEHQLARLLKLMANKWQKEGRIDPNEKLGVTRQSIHFWETGVYKPSRQSLKLLNAVFRAYKPTDRIGYKTERGLISQIKKANESCIKHGYQTQLVINLPIKKGRK